MTEESQASRAELRALHAEIKKLREANVRLEEERIAAQQELDLIRSSAVWRMLARLRHVRAQVFRPGTRRDRLFRQLMMGTDGALRLGVGRTLTTAVTNPRRLIPALRAARAKGLASNRRYQAWLERHQLTDTRVDEIRTTVEALPAQPIISLLMPVYNTGSDWLRAAVDSVRGQLYPHWELCLVDDASTAPHIAPMLRDFVASDPRIKLLSLTVNEGISGASNHALALASGEFVAPLDHDDTLAKDALYEVVKRLVDDPTIDIIYTDNDLRDADGVRRGPFFKPDWSPDLLLSMNYITHFAVYRRELVTRVGGFRKGMEGSQDFDLLLRATEQARTIAHVAKPLYSWGQAPASVAFNPGAKPYAHEAGRRAIQEALTRRGIEGEVLDGHGAPFRYRVKRRIQGTPLVSIIIPTRDNKRLLERCVDSLENGTNYQHFEIIIVDNQSQDPATVAYLRASRHRIVSFDEPFNFSRMNNVAAAEARGEHLLFLNDDTEAIAPDWLEAMVEHSQRPEVGAVGARLLFPNDTVQHAGVIVGIQGKAGHAFWGFPADHPGYYDQLRVIRNYSAVTGACLMMRRALFADLGGFAEAFAISYNDIDLCLRIRENGYLVVYTPYALLYHHQSASRGAYDAEKDRKYEELLRERWQTVFDKGDPYYNPHLTLTGFDFSLRLS